MPMESSTGGGLKVLLTSNSWLKPLLKAVGNARCRAWDLIHAVDTCGDVPLATLDFQNKNKTAGLEYQSHHPRIIREGLMSLKIRYQDYTFVDLAVAKGESCWLRRSFRSAKSSAWSSRRNWRKRQ